MPVQSDWCERKLDFASTSASPRQAQAQALHAQPAGGQAALLKADNPPRPLADQQCRQAVPMKSNQGNRAPASSSCTPGAILGTSAAVATLSDTFPLTRMRRTFSRSTLMACVWVAAAVAISSVHAHSTIRLAVFTKSVGVSDEMRQADAECEERGDMSIEAATNTSKPRLRGQGALGHGLQDRDAKHLRRRHSLIGICIGPAHVHQAMPELQHTQRYV